MINVAWFCFFPPVLFKYRYWEYKCHSEHFDVTYRSSGWKRSQHYVYPMACISHGANQPDDALPVQWQTWSPCVPRATGMSSSELYHVVNLSCLLLIIHKLNVFNHLASLNLLECSSASSSAAIRLAGHQRLLPATIGIHHLVEVTELRRFEINWNFLVLINENFFPN